MVKLSEYRPLSQLLSKWFNLTALELRSNEALKFKFKYLITPDGWMRGGYFPKSSFPIIYS